MNLLNLIKKVGFLCKKCIGKFANKIFLKKKIFKKSNSWVKFHAEQF